MRHSNPSSVARPGDILALEGEGEGEDYNTTASPASSSSHTASQPAPTPMSPYESSAWSGSSSLGHAVEEYESGSDHEMTDIEDGGAPLTVDLLDASSHAGDLISPLTGSVMHTTTSFTGVSPDAGDLNDTMTLDHAHDLPTAAAAAASAAAAAAAAAAASTTMLLPPPPTVTLPSAQLQPFAQQALSNIPTTPQHMLFLQQMHQQQLQLLANGNTEDEFAELHQIPFHQNPNSLGPDNMSLAQFLQTWAHMDHSRDAQPRPHMDRIRAVFRKQPPMTHVEYRQLNGDKCDLQGINWEDLGVQRSKARDRRRSTYSNYVNLPGSDKWHPALPDQYAVPCENFFRFRRMDIRQDVRLLHFQLRNILGCASRTRAFFPALGGTVRELDPTTGRTRRAMSFGTEADVQVSTLTADSDILVVGGFLGDYRFRNVHSKDRMFTEGKLTDNISGITNHVQIHSARRSATPIAAFASNDFGFRTVDLTTNQMLSETMYQYPLNCSAVSSDRRLRVMVGDSTNVLITDAESGEILQSLGGHRDYGFACDWAPDGWTVATGFQDKSVRIWDARKWKSTHTGKGSPVAVLRMAESGARSLRFSPLGSGKRVLVAAEEADVINVIDAQTFVTQQKIEVFGEIGGTAFADDGRTLMALIADQSRGGVMQFDRCDAGAEDMFDYKTRGVDPRLKPWWQSNGYDWADDPVDIVRRPDSLETFTERRRKAVTLGNLDPF